MTQHTSNLPFTVAALYRFARLDHYQSLQEPLAKLCCGEGIKGTLLLAAEGINGTVAGSAAAMKKLIDFLEAEPAIAGMELKYSHASEMPFKRSAIAVDAATAPTPTSPRVHSQSPTPALPAISAMMSA